MWALGLFLFNFIEGKNPFNSGDINRTYSRILKGEFDFTSDNMRWLSGKNPLSPDSKDLINKLL